MNVKSVISSNIFASIFGDIDKFCGKEDVIHAIIYHHLLEAGLSSAEVAREQPISKNRIDIVVFDEQIQGQFNKTNIIPKIAMEVKGGAYGNRNALKDTINPDGTCDDMQKLEKEIDKGIDCWFICVDMPELGRSIDDSLLKKIHNQCKQRKISFAYYCQGEDFFFYAPYDMSHSIEKINQIVDTGCDLHVVAILNKNNHFFNTMCDQLLRINGHEANTTAALYRLFRQSGLSVPQVSLETYFSFAKMPGSRMQLRPDLVLFNKGFDGMFNLYKKGNRKHSNDPHKMAHINTILEVKGSASMNSMGEQKRLNIYLEDIQKLKNWQALAHDNGCQSLNGYFICLDGHKKPLSQSALQEMFNYSANNPVVYISNNGVEISN